MFSIFWMLARFLFVASVFIGLATSSISMTFVAPDMVKLSGGDPSVVRSLQVSFGFLALVCSFLSYYMLDLKRTQFCQWILKLDRDMLFRVILISSLWLSISAILPFFVPLIIIGAVTFEGMAVVNFFTALIAMIIATVLAHFAEIRRHKDAETPIVN